MYHTLSRAFAFVPLTKPNPAAPNYKDLCAAALAEEDNDNGCACAFGKSNRRDRVAVCRRYQKLLAPTQVALYATAAMLLRSLSPVWVSKQQVTDLELDLLLTKPHAPDSLAFVNKVTVAATARFHVLRKSKNNSSSNKNADASILERLLLVRLARRCPHLEELSLDDAGEARGCWASRGLNRTAISLMPRLRAFSDCTMGLVMVARRSVLEIDPAVINDDEDAEGGDNDRKATDTERLSHINGILGALPLTLERISLVKHAYPKGPFPEFRDLMTVLRRLIDPLAGGRLQDIKLTVDNSNVNDFMDIVNTPEMLAALRTVEFTCLTGSLERLKFPIADRDCQLTSFKVDYGSLDGQLQKEFPLSIQELSLPGAVDDFECIKSSLATLPNLIKLNISACYLRCNFSTFARALPQSLRELTADSCRLHGVLRFGLLPRGLRELSLETNMFRLTDRPDDEEVEEGAVEPAPEYADIRNLPPNLELLSLQDNTVDVNATGELDASLLPKTLRVLRLLDSGISRVTVHNLPPELRELIADLGNSDVIDLTQNLPPNLETMVLRGGEVVVDPARLPRSLRALNLGAKLQHSPEYIASKFTFAAGLPENMVELTLHKDDVAHVKKELLPPRLQILAASDRGYALFGRGQNLMPFAVAPDSLGAALEDQLNPQPDSGAVSEIDEE